MSLSIWNVKTGEIIKKLKNPSGIGKVTSVAFSPDGKIIVSAYRREQDIRIWDVERGKVTKILKHKDDDIGVRAIVFSPDGKRLASISNDSLQIWSVEEST